jgi:hypothetical protein
LQPHACRQRLFHHPARPCRRASSAASGRPLALLPELVAVADGGTAPPDRSGRRSARPAPGSRGSRPRIQAHRTDQRRIAPPAGLPRAIRRRTRRRSGFGSAGPPGRTERLRGRRSRLGRGRGIEGTRAARAHAALAPGLGHAGHGDDKHARQGEREASAARRACRLAFRLTVPLVGRTMWHQMFFPEIRIGWSALLFSLSLRTLLTEGEGTAVKRHRLADGPLQSPAHRTRAWWQVMTLARLLECSMSGIRSWLRP